MSKTRRNHTPEFKARVVLELLREEMTVNELAAKHQISPVLISRWKTEVSTVHNAIHQVPKYIAFLSVHLYFKHKYVQDFIPNIFVPVNARKIRRVANSFVQAAK